jgi:prenyltransferase beta subunit
MKLQQAAGSHCDRIDEAWVNEWLARRSASSDGLQERYSKTGQIVTASSPPDA